MGGQGHGLPLKFFPEDNISDCPLKFVLKDGEALLEGKIVLGIDKLTIDRLIVLVDEVHTKIIRICTTLERIVQSTLSLTRFANCINEQLTIRRCHIFFHFLSLLHRKPTKNYYI